MVLHFLKCKSIPTLREAMTTDAPETVYLKDYTKPDYKITSTFLDFDIYEGHTRVKSRLECVADYSDNEATRPLVLNGEDMTLISVAIDGTRLKDSEYTVDDATLTLLNIPKAFTL